MRLTRGQVLAYRAAVSDLTRRVDTPENCRALATGVQDTPPGTTAARALLARTGPGGHEAVRAVPGTAVVHSMRATMHLHRTADLGLYAAALRPGDAAEIAVPQQGLFFQELQAEGVTPGEALDQVAAAMREVMRDGVPRTKGELSGAVRPLVDTRLRPWCGGCGIDHVHDGLFRYATLPAGLAVVPSDDSSMFRFHLVQDGVPEVAGETARRELIRRFLHACGPARYGQLAAWLALSPAAGRAMWRLLESELAPVEVDGVVRFVHGDDLERVANPPEPPRLRLVPPYDPLLEIVDRELVVPDPARRRRIWRAVANPGVILRYGECAGVWRHRTVRHRLVVTTEPFEPLAMADLTVVTRDAEALARLAGLGGAEVRSAN